MNIDCRGLYPFVDQCLSLKELAMIETPWTWKIYFIPKLRRTGSICFGVSPSNLPAEAKRANRF
jgi:hypothetical protein